MNKPPCEKDCPRRSIAPNCHSPICEDWVKYEESCKANRAARVKRMQEINDIASVRCGKLSKMFERNRNGLPKKY